MNSPRKAVSWLAPWLVLALSAPQAHAGFGDMLKEKAKKTIQGDKKGKDAKDAKQAGAESGGIKSAIEPPATPENVAKFKTSLQLEISEREKAIQFLKTLKSSDDYNKCKQDFLISADGQKLSQKYMDVVSASGQPDYQKRLEAIGAEMEKQVAAHCGPDPGTYTGGWHAQAMRDALGKGSDAFSKNDYDYNTWKEWVTEFCKYIEELKKDSDYKTKLAKIKDEGLRIPGTAKGLYYVYTASEANQLLEQCDALMPLIDKTL